ncbi:MAG: hypothetical protein RL213_1148 [Bacteroidota bacterium]|jgi:uncharacterized membrane protein YcaP (DUF421 family)
MHPLLEVVLRTVTVYLFVILALRIFGKKELSQLSVIDLVFILLISNSVQNAMVGPDATLTGGLVAAGSLFLLNFLLKNLLYRSPRISRLLQGEPVLLVHRGKILKANLEREKISFEELQTVIREHGVPGIDDVDLAVLEPDGNISILSQDYSRRSSKKRRAHKAITK